MAVKIFDEEGKSRDVSDERPQMERPRIRESERSTKVGEAIRRMREMLNTPGKFSQNERGNVIRDLKRALDKIPYNNSVYLNERIRIQKEELSRLAQLWICQRLDKHSLSIALESFDHAGNFYQSDSIKNLIDALDRLDQESSSYREHNR